MEWKVETEVSPQLPTSGQIFGVLVKSLGLKDDRLRSKTAQRYFSGLMDSIVKDSSRSEIIEAFSDAMAEMGFQLSQQSGQGVSESVLSSVLDYYALDWDRLRTFLLPRMSRVYLHHLGGVWQTYLRLTVIDLALRVAAYIYLTGRPRSALDLLLWTSVERRGSYLNEKRKSADITLFKFAELVDMTENAVEAWLYQAARPSDENLSKIAQALSSDSDLTEYQKTLSELRMLYWISNIAEKLSEHIGTDAVCEIVGRFHKYASDIYRMIEDGPVVGTIPAEISGLLDQGSRSSLARRLLAELVREETDSKWKDDLLATGSDWIGRVLAVNLQIHVSEENELIEKTEGQILKDWDISNPQAYEHYRRSMELQKQGRMDEAVAEVVKAVELDPMDPANHFTLGSAKGGIGLKNGNEALVDEGIEACWIAVTLDPNWILPWTEIGWLLLGIGRAAEAVDHLQSIKPDCGPLDSRYYQALGLALERLGRPRESLEALETSVKLNPDDPRIVIEAALIAMQLGDNVKSNLYRKIARHLGFSEELERYLELVKATKADLLWANMATVGDEGLTNLDIPTASRLDEASARGMPGAARRGNLPLRKAQGGRGERSETQGDAPTT